MTRYRDTTPPPKIAYSADEAARAPASASVEGLRYPLTLHELDWLQNVLHE